MTANLWDPAPESTVKSMRCRHILAAIPTVHLSRFRPFAGTAIPGTSIDARVTSGEGVYGPAGTCQGVRETFCWRVPLPGVGVTATTAASTSSTPRVRSNVVASWIVAPVVSTSSTSTTRSPASARRSRQPHRRANRRERRSARVCPVRGTPPAWRIGRTSGAAIDLANETAISPTGSMPRCHRRSGEAGTGTTMVSALPMRPPQFRNCSTSLQPRISALTASQPYLTRSSTDRQSPCSSASRTTRRCRRRSPSQERHGSRRSPSPTESPHHEHHAVGGSASRR